MTVNNTFSRIEPPFAVRVPIDPLDPFGPQQTVIGTTKTQNHNVSAGVAQRNLLGGTSQAAVRQRRIAVLAGSVSRSTPRIATRPNSATRSRCLRGAGVLANRVPIVLARIDTERSFFQLRDSLQELVRSVIEAYWQVVFARTDVWAREIQVQQAEEAYNRAEARFRAAMADVTETAQARAALAQFRANSISSRANLLSREAALAGILGLPTIEPLALAADHAAHERSGPVRLEPGHRQSLKSVARI